MALRRWKKTPLLDYPGETPQPGYMDRVEKMTAREKRELLSWVSQTQAMRCKVLANHYLHHCNKSVELDNTVDSLSRLWKFYSPMLREDAKSKTIATYKHPHSEEILQFEDSNISRTSLDLCVDISFYLASIVQTKFSDAQWTIGTKYQDKNRLGLTGFRELFVPFAIIRAYAWGSITRDRPRNGFQETLSFWESNRLLAK